MLVNTVTISAMIDKVSEWRKYQNDKKLSVDEASEKVGLTTDQL